MQADGLRISDVSPSVAITDEKLWVEAPSNDRIEDQIVLAIQIERARNLNEVPLLRIEAGPTLVS